MYIYYLVMCTFIYVSGYLYQKVFTLLCIDNVSVLTGESVQFYDSIQYDDSVQYDDSLQFTHYQLNPTIQQRSAISTAEFLAPARWLFGMN